MNLALERKWFTDKATIGCLYIENIFYCYTLEDCWRPDHPKVPGETCIPNGRYKVVIDWSKRFQRMMPHLLDVPGFEGIRIHPGNTPYDTEGCILVGQERGLEHLERSRLAFNDFFQKLQDAENKGEETTIEVLVT